MRQTLELTYKFVRRIVIFIVGVSVVLIGIVMFVTPGPAIIVIPAGLAILGLEFAWARHWLKLMKEKTKEVAEKARVLKNKGKDKSKAKDEL